MPPTATIDAGASIDTDAVGYPPDEELDDGATWVSSSELVAALSVADAFEQLLRSIDPSDLDADDVARAAYAATHHSHDRAIRRAVGGALRSNLDSVAFPLPAADDRVPSTLELRGAQATLVGWGSGVLNAMEANRAELQARRLAARDAAHAHDNGVGHYL